MRIFLKHKKLRWSIHNIIAHPLMEVCNILGYNDLGSKIHNITIPQRRQHETT